MLCLAVFVMLWAGVWDLLCVCIVGVLGCVCCMFGWLVVHACDMCGMDFVLCCCMC